MFTTYTEVMRAVVNDRYGPSEGLRLAEVPRPVVGDDGVLVRVSAASINPFDWHLMRGSPLIVRLLTGVRRPGEPFLGVDVAGTVEAVGASVREFRPGDDVLGSCSATFAEYVAASEQSFVLKPPSMSFEQAGALPGAGVTALLAVRDHALITPGERVLVNGASGGVGTFVVQIAKAFGAHVTGVCSAGNSELVRSLGADEVIDYATEDFTRSGRRYDVVVDNVGNRSLLRLARALEPNGRLVAVAGGEGGWLLGGLRRKLRVRLLNPLVGPTLSGLRAHLTKENMLALTELVAAGKVTPFVDRTYPLEEVADAIRYVETRHARGKVVLVVASRSAP